jgi:hypothetical protein
MSAGRYRKKPVVVEAFQWTGFNYTKSEKFMGEKLAGSRFSIAPGPGELCSPSVPASGPGEAGTREQPAPGAACSRIGKREQFPDSQAGTTRSQPALFPCSRIVSGEAGTAPPAMACGKSSRLSRLAAGEVCRPPVTGRQVGEAVGVEAVRPGVCLCATRPAARPGQAAALRESPVRAARLRWTAEESPMIESFLLAFALAVVVATLMFPPWRW